MERDAIQHDWVRTHEASWFMRNHQKVIYLPWVTPAKRRRLRGVLTWLFRYTVLWPVLIGLAIAFIYAVNSLFWRQW